MTQHRAYSLLETKSIDEDQRIITGIATTPTTDRMGDIVEPKGAEFKLPIPLLWQHDHGQPIGHVIAARVTKDGIEVTAQFVKIDEPGVLKDRLDEAWQAVKSKLVRGLSIGFKSIESARINGTHGIRFLKWLWLELSTVTVAANGECTVQTIKSIDCAQRGVTQTRVVTIPPGASGTPVAKPKPQEGAMNIAEQIKALEETRRQKHEKLNEIQEKASKEGRTKDAAEREEFDSVGEEIKALDAELADLRSLEEINKTKAAPVSQTPSTTAAQQSREPATVKTVEKLEPGIQFARYVMCHVAAKGNPAMAFNLARMHYSADESLVKTIQAQADGWSIEKAMQIKATVAAGTTTDSTWAGPLVQYQNFAGDFVEFLRPQTILGRFGNGGIPSLTRVPFNVRIAGQTSGGSGYWVGEGLPKPLTKFDFNATELRWAKVANIAVLTEELMRFSDPSAERLVRDALAKALIERLDIDFIDPAKAAVANVSPASILNGVSAISSSGSDADAVRADLLALWAPFIAANNPPSTAVYIMSSMTALSLSLMRNALGNKEFPDITIRGGTLEGVPVIVSDYADNTAGSAGGLVILVNASDIWLADDGQVNIDASREASLQMLDNPTNASSTATATTMVSMFQTNSVAVRAERFINWAKRRSSAAAYLDAVTWGQ